MNILYRQAVENLEIFDTDGILALHLLSACVIAGTHVMLQM